jgi:phage protein D
MAEPVQSARPTILVAGREEPGLAGGLLRLRIEERLEGLYACEASFGNWDARNGDVDFAYFDRQLLDFGKELTVRLGQDTLFAGRVTGLEAGFPEASPPTITVLAEDRLQDLRMTRRTRAFADVADRDVMSQIASDHGLTPDLDLNGPTHKVLAQLDQSDLAFLRERARAVDAEVWVNGRTLAAKSHGSRNGGKLTIAHGGALREFEVLADLADQRTSVDVGGWDVAGKRALRETADSSVLGAELGGGDGGGSVLRSALGERKESVAHTVALTSQEARARAEALYKRRARRFIRGRGIAETSSALRVGATVKLDRLGPLFSGDYYVTEVRHGFEGATGLRTEFAAERPGLGKPR